MEPKYNYKDIFIPVTILYFILDATFPYSLQKIKTKTIDHSHHADYQILKLILA